MLASRTSTPVATPRVLAARLLENIEVRAVTFDAGAGEATVHYGDRTVRDSLTEIAKRVQADSARMAGSQVVGPPEIEVWPDAVTGRDSYVRAPQQATGLRRVMHLSLAAVWFTLAVLGAILPGLPCTGFLILCSYSLCRSSKRLHKKLLDSKWFGPMLRHWQVHRGVRPGVKTKALSMLILMVGASLAFAPLPAIAWWAVAVAGAIGAWVVSRLRVVAV